jgi:DNA-binding transcriptional regulator LsrR (DeoR family)
MSEGQGSEADRSSRKMDQAARAAWLYYVGGHTQDEIAVRLNVSRPAAQRLVSLAVSEGLVRFRIDHPMIECIEMGARMCDRYGLRFCDVVPLSGEAAGHTVLGIAGAERIESYLSQRQPISLAFGTGRALRAAVAQVQPMQRPQHKVVSLVSNLARDGRASPYDAVFRLADRVGAQCYPLALPLVNDTAEGRAFLQAQRPYQTILSIVEEAAAAFVGVGDIDANAPLVQEGFINEAELAELMHAHAVGEICSWTFDATGKFVEHSLSALQTSVPLTVLPALSLIAIAGGRNKLRAMRAALRGGFLGGLITDEWTAARLLEPEPAA